MNKLLYLSWVYCEITRAVYFFVAPLRLVGKVEFFNGAGQGKVHAAYSGHEPDLSVLGPPLPSDQQLGFMSFFHITPLRRRSFLFPVFKYEIVILEQLLRYNSIHKNTLFV